MKSIFSTIFAAIFFLLPSLNNNSVVKAQARITVKGIVFHDKNENAVYDSDEDEPLENVAVSNGIEVVVTDRYGEYELPLRNNSAIFVIKPRNWAVPVDEKQNPRFYQIYSSTGIMGTKFEGLAATSLLPESVDFPLYPAEEPDKLKVLIFGDTQPRNDREIYFMSEDVIPELIGTDADFGVTLGDVVFDNLNLYDHIQGVHASIGIPWRYVAGNHDYDFTGNNSTEARGTWFKHFGPSYYSFTHGPAHFVVLDNIRWIVEGDNRYYRTGLGESQMKFLKNEMERLNENQLLVLMAHIPYQASKPWYDEAEKQAFYELIASHSNTVSLVSHTHEQYHHFIDSDQGFPGKEPHHMISIGTVCGAWWTGAPDEYGIPHAMMKDGTPNGYAFLNINGNSWNLKWKTAGVSKNFQMHIVAPNVISANNNEGIKVIANIYNALPDAEVKMRIGDNGEWIEMKRNPQKDPVRLAEKERENQMGDLPWRKMGGDANSKHIWEAELNANLEPGVHSIQVKATDDWFEYEGKKLVHVE